MLKRLAYILVAGSMMAGVFWLLFWIHHSLVVGLNPFLDILFIAVGIIFLLPGIIWGMARLRWPVWELFAVGCACWIWWSIGWRMLMGHSTLDIFLHDTVYVIANFHFVVFFPLMMLVFTGIYYLLERKVCVNRTLGCIHFWVTFIGLWYLLWPGSYEGLAGMPRRYVDLGYSHGFNRFVQVNETMAIVAMVVVAVQFVFVGMVVYSVARIFLKTNMRALIPLLLAALTVTTATAQKDYTSAIDSFMQSQVQFRGFNGNVLVAKSGKVLYQRSFGYSNFDTKAPLDENSLFELASVSKQFTAVGILLLKDEGRLSLSDTLRKFFPELPYSHVTIRHLLTHTSGLPDYMGAMIRKWDHKKIAFNTDVIQFLATERIPADFRPGEKCVYSNTGYQMLASIIEKVSGEPYEVYMMEHVFKPAGLQRTRIYNTRRSGETIPNYAYGYTYVDSLRPGVLPDSVKALDFVFYLDGIVGDGTVNSTTGDLLLWDRALKEHKLLNAATQKQMFTPQHLFDSTIKNYYGYGEFLGTNEIGPYITHSGGWPGYHTVLTRYTNQDLTLIVLSNYQSDAEGVAGGLAYIITGRTVVLPYVHLAIQLDSTALDRFVGKYNVPYAGEISIVRKGDKLYRYKTGASEIELLPESPQKIFYKGWSDTQIEFEWDNRGKAKKVFFIHSGMKKEITPIK